MGTLGSLVTLFSIASLLLTFWLAFIAFKRGVWWGLAVLFLSPITAIIFAVKYWKESKTPFLAYIFTETVFISLLIHMFVSMGASELIRLAQQQRQHVESSKKEVIQIIDRIIEHMESYGTVKEQEKEGVHEIKSLPLETRSPQRVEEKVHSETPSQQIPTGYKPIAVTKAGNYIGISMKVVVRNGSEHKGRLKYVAPDKLIFEKFLHGGKFAFEIKTADIKSLQVYR